MNNGTENSTDNSYNAQLLCPTLQYNVLSLLVAANAINLILGVPSNGYILWLMLSRAGGVPTLEFFSLNLAMSEMLFGLANLYSFLLPFHCTLNVQRAMAFFTVFLFIGRPLFQTCICVERYLAVVHPLLLLRYKPLRYRVAWCSVVWLLVLGCGFIFTFVSSFGPVYLQNAVVCLYLFLFSAILYCCLSVLRALKQPGPGEGEKQKGRSNDLKSKAFKVILIITVSMVMTYIPFVIILILHNYISANQFNLSFTVCALIAIMTGFVQPLLYLQRTGKLPCIKSQ